MDFAKIMKDEINRKRKKLDSDLKVNKDNKKAWVFIGIGFGWVSVTWKVCGLQCRGLQCRLYTVIIRRGVQICWLCSEQP